MKLFGKLSFLVSLLALVLLTGGCKKNSRKDTKVIKGQMSMYSEEYSHLPEIDGATSIHFTKVELPHTSGRHSSLTIGPDGKLYALTVDGIIKRFAMEEDGSLGVPEQFYTIQDADGARTQRLSIGLCFDPTSTAENLILYVTHHTFTLSDGPEWDGNISRITGQNLEKIEKIITQLPRSKKDHLTNSIAFGPDGALYFNQGSLSAMGKADKTWGYRDESLLSAAVLRLDLQKLNTLELPLNVKTFDSGGDYDPLDKNAPLTIYATGLRNAYDLLWHSNGELYIPTNGSATGGNIPKTIIHTKRLDGTLYNGPFAPAINKVAQVQRDYLFRVEKGGYYGHPNPSRGEFIMNGGNPTKGYDPAQIDKYPIGTKPDKNWRGYSFDFNYHNSPNGVIEYKGSAFNGKLKGKILVARYVKNQDILILEPGTDNKDIIKVSEGTKIGGLSGFTVPLDLVEDTRTGNVYVSEFGGEGQISLLKPEGEKPVLALNHVP